MPQDDQGSGGLLSKVVKFVRNSSANWADLDQPEPDRDSQYSKQMLKEMIERKRRNDFVRRREFDQLRKLRQRGAVAGDMADGDAAGRPSFFQSSQPSRADDREGTLKKIDEIEAQMAQQWWTRNQGLPGSVPVAADAGATPVDGDGLIDESESDAHHYAATVPATLPGDGEGEFGPRARAARAVATPDPAPLLPDWLPPPEATTRFVHDPALEEAAIRFANGDMAGAEAALLPLLTPGARATPELEEIWLTLFDFYRASGQQDRFGTAAIEFTRRFGRSAPAWFAMHSGPSPLGRGRPDDGALLHWVSPSALGPDQVDALQARLLARTPATLVLDWTALHSVQQAAAAPLARVLDSLARQPLLIHCAGADHLERLLSNFTVQGARHVDQAWWRLRFEWLRVLNRPNDFDLVALDYCVTYEVSPPAWQDVHCRMVEVDGPAPAPAASAAGGLDSSLPDSTAPSTLPQGPDGQIGAAGVLLGVVKGDASSALAPLDAHAQRSGLVVVSCERLVRLDFAAAGSVLNWAAMLQASGVRVQFRELHRLVAVFLNVVGVGEHATVLPRRH